MSESPRVGFVGLGDLGGPMARRIIEAGFSTSLWARRSTTLDQFAASDFGRPRDLADLGRDSDIVGVCVFSDDDVRQVLLGDNAVLAGMAPGSIILIHSTVDVTTCREIAAAADARDVAVLDAPVSGTHADAQVGKLVVMVGGNEHTLQRAMPVLNSFSSLVRRVGPLGSGLTLKALNNVTSFCNARVAVAAIEAGCRLGLELDAVMSILRVSGATSRMMERIIDQLMPDPAFQAHAATMVDKDTRVFGEICRQAGVSAPLLHQLATDWAQQLVPKIEF